MDTRPNRDAALDHPIYCTIVGDRMNTNVGLARFMAVILAFILVGGFLFWLVR